MTLRTSLLAACAVSILGFGFGPAAMAQTDPAAPPAATAPMTPDPAAEAPMKKPMKKHMAKKKHMMGKSKAM